MACQLLFNLFEWALKHETKQPSFKLSISAYGYKFGDVPSLKGSGAGPLYYSPAQVVPVGRFHIQIPALFGGEITYVQQQNAGPSQKINVQILDFGTSYPM